MNLEGESNTMFKKIVFLCSVLILLFSIVMAAADIDYGNDPNYRCFVIKAQIVEKDVNNGKVTFKNLRKDDGAIFIVDNNTKFDELGMEAIEEGKTVFAWVLVNPDTGKMLIDTGTSSVYVPKILITDKEISDFGSSSTQNSDVLYLDIPENSVLFDITSKLSNYKILSGYPDGSFRPDAFITRAEMVKILLSLVSMQEAKFEGTSVFSDVAYSYWAYDNIHVAKDLGYIAGNGDGTFSPDGNVTYEQAVKMVVSLLGYSTDAISKGGYPEGYLLVSKEIKLINGLDFKNNDFATRGNIALLLNNAIDIPLQIQTAYGDKVNFEIYNGVDFPLKTIFTEYL